MTTKHRLNRKTQEKDPSRGRLLRSPSERMVAGVAGGTAQYLGVDPTFVRLGFVVASFFGGFGLLAYLVMAVVVPQDDGTGNPVEGRPPTWAIVLLAIVALIVLPGPFFGWRRRLVLRDRHALAAGPDRGQRPRLPGGQGREAPARLFSGSKARVGGEDRGRR